jgi:TQXA domain-containing protein
MTRYRGGTYSHTVDTIVFSDGSSARTDLIRLNPNIDAYSLDFAAQAPVTPSRYRADSWAAVPHLQTRAHEAEVDWILRNSYPVLSTTELSRRLRAAGYPLGNRNIAEHEAIAGTQAAIWRFTNGLELDTRPLNVPVRVERDANGVTIEFDGPRQLAGYTAKLLSRNGATLTLQKSADGRHWKDVAASRISVLPGAHDIVKALGVGSTIADSWYGSRGGGYRHYRLAINGDASILDTAFRLGARKYRNPEPIVFLYKYLLAGAEKAREATVTPSLTADGAVVVDDLIGPFQLHTTDAAAIALTAGNEALYADGTAVSRPIQPGEDFYVRRAPGSTGTTVRVEVPGHPDGFGGRVITGVAHDEVEDRFTPLALAVPAKLVVEFDIAWG